MKLFLVLIFISNLGFSQLRNQELDGVIVTEAEQKEAIIEKSIITNTNSSNRYISNSQMKELISNNRIAPLPYNPESGFGGLILDLEGNIGICRDAPEPSTNSLLLLGTLIVLYYNRKFNAHKQSNT